MMEEYSGDFSAICQAMSGRRRFVFELVKRPLQVFEERIQHAGLGECRKRDARASVDGLIRQGGTGGLIDALK